MHFDIVNIVNTQMDPKILENYAFISLYRKEHVSTKHFLCILFLF